MISRLFDQRAAEGLVGEQLLEVSPADEVRRRAEPFQLKKAYQPASPIGRMTKTVKSNRAGGRKRRDGGSPAVREDVADHSAPEGGSRRSGA